MAVLRYHSILVILHWLIGLMIFANLGFGFVFIRNMENSDPEKLTALAGHMGMGTMIIVLMLIRLIVRYFTSHPEPTAHQREGVGALRTQFHRLLYVVIFITAIAGWLTGFQIAHLFEQPGNTLPADFPAMNTRVIHVWMVLLLFLMILLHIAAAIRERVMGERGIMSRMWFGKRTS